MSWQIRHLALYVPDLREAESYYRHLFELELVGREAIQNDGEWYSLPREKDWDDAIEAGISLKMTALRRGDFTLALFQGDPTLGQVFAIGLRMPAEEINVVRLRLPSSATIFSDQPEQLNFRDRYQIMWQLTLPGSDFRTSGDGTGRWLKLD